MSWNQGEGGWPQQGHPQGALPPQGHGPQHGHAPQHGQVPHQGHPQPAPGWGPAPHLGAGGPHGAPPPSTVGFDLYPGEVLYLFRPTVGDGSRAIGWMFGVLLVPMVVGIIILYVMTRGGKRPAAVAVTNHRIVQIQPSGHVVSHPLQGVVDLEPFRRNVHVQGGGLVGALVGAAISAGLDALANRKQKLDPAYWTRATGVTLTYASGQKPLLDLDHVQAPQVGVMIAHLLAGAHHTLRPLDPGSFAGSLDPSRPQPGVVQRIVSMFLLLGSLFIVTRGIDMWGLHGEADGLVPAFIATGALGMLGAVGLFVWGTLAARTSNLARPTSPAHAAAGIGAAPAAPRAFTGGDIGFAVGFGLLTLVALLVVGSSIATAVTREPVSRSRPLAAATPGTPTGPARPVPPPGDLTFDRVDGVLRAGGYSLTSPAEPSTMGAAVHATFNTTKGPWVALWDFTCPSPAGGAAACFGGPTHGVSVELMGTADPARQAGLPAESRALAQALLTERPSARGLVATLQRRGYRVTDTPTDGEFTFAHRTYLLFASKGDVSATVHVADYTRAAARQDGAIVRVVGADVLLVSAQYGGGVTEADALAAQIIGR